MLVDIFSVTTFEYDNCMTKVKSPFSSNWSCILKTTSFSETADNYV